MVSRFARSAIFAAICVCVGTAVQAAERHALLIGVTEYPEDTRDLVPSLAGPRNDIVLVHRTLTDGWGDDARITVLADSLERSAYDWDGQVAGLPTRREIIDAFERLERETAPGDEVLIYLSGHGSQIPMRPGSAGREADGLEEIFLPGDFRIRHDRDDGTVTIENHIVDDEIGTAVERLVARGVFVWLVVDACHSGTMERSAAPAGQARFVTTLLEGSERLIDLNAAKEERQSEIKAGKTDDAAPSIEITMPSEGGFVGFYAAIASELAMEYPLPKDAPENSRRPHGLMTWTLVEALRSGQAATYEDLARSVTSEFWQWGNGAPRPMFVGHLRRTAMVDARGERSWSVSTRNRTLYLSGGRLDGVEEGAVVVVTQSPKAGGEPLFFAQVTRSAIEEARLEIVTDDPGRPDRIGEVLLQEGLTTRASHRWLWLEDRAPSFRAEIVSRPVPFVLRVSRPTAPDNSLGQARARLVDEKLLGLAEAPPVDTPVALDIRDMSEPADLRLVIRNGRLWFVPELGAVITDGRRQAYSLPIEGLDAETLGAALRQIGRARNLLQIAETFSGTETARALSLRLAVEERAPDPATGACAPHPREEPARAPEAARIVSDFGPPPSMPVRVGHCDRVYLILRNAGDTPLDVSPFYFSPHSEIYYLRAYRDAVFFGLRVRPGETRVVSYTENTAASDGSITPVGPMRLVLIAVEADSADAPASDFRHLEGNLPALRRSDDPVDRGLLDLLDAASFGGGEVRAAQTGRETGRAGSVIVPLETFAPEES